MDKRDQQPKRLTQMCLQWDIQHDGSIDQEATLQAQNLISAQEGAKL